VSTSPITQIITALTAPGAPNCAAAYEAVEALKRRMFGEGERLVFTAAYAGQPGPAPNLKTLPKLVETLATWCRTHCPDDNPELFLRPYVQMDSRISGIAHISGAIMDEPPDRREFRRVVCAADEALNALARVLVMVGSIPGNCVQVSLDKDDARILNVWSIRPLWRLNIDQIAGFTTKPRLARRTVAARLPFLEQMGLIGRPRGLKGGYVRTATGERILAEFVSQATK
jgi:hypothetical protein